MAVSPRGYETAMAGRDLTEIRASYARWCMAIRRLRVARHVLGLRAGRGLHKRTRSVRVGHADATGARQTLDSRDQGGE